MQAATVLACCGGTDTARFLLFLRGWALQTKGRQEAAMGTNKSSEWESVPFKGAGGSVPVMGL